MNNLLEPEFAEPFNTWKASQRPEDADRLLTAINPVIDSAITSYARGDKSPLLRSRARRMTLDSLQRYRPEESKMKSYLLTQLRGLQRETTNLTNIIHMPEAVLLERNRLHNAQRELEDELGREPSDIELSDKVQLPLKRLAYIRGIQRPVGESAAGGQSYGGDPAVRDLAAQEEQAWSEMIYHDQDPINQLIMEYGMGLHGKPRLGATEIARKLNLSPGAISQRSKRIQAQLDQRTELQAF
jgi:DNA-directed RNA polymerase specialized sigma subunit